MYPIKFKRKPLDNFNILACRLLTPQCIYQRILGTYSFAGHKHLIRHRENVVSDCTPFISQLLLAKLPACKEETQPANSEIMMPLLWTAGYGYEVVVRLPSAKDGVDTDFRDAQEGGTPLSCTALILQF
jgi:hypothetical protein